MVLGEQGIRAPMRLGRNSFLQSTGEKEVVFRMGLVGYGFPVIFQSFLVSRSVNLEDDRRSGYHSPGGDDKQLRVFL